MVIGKIGSPTSFRKKEGKEIVLDNTIKRTALFFPRLHIYDFFGVVLYSVPGQEVQVAINLKKNRVEWKRNRPSRRF